jgi:UDP-N-acetylmuramoyl-L-alanyl-D-glutamate--2,6-diaminopimelate ligase
MKNGIKVSWKVKMKLRKLLKEIPHSQFKGSKDIEITGICSNSKLVAPGNLFIARKGMSEDGSRYIPEAIASGAVAVITDILDPSLSIAQIIHPCVMEVEGIIASHYYQFPCDELFLVGITGTNGKTTTAFLVKHMLDSLKWPCGLIGTIEYIIGPHRYSATRTTPDVSTNHKMLREMICHQCRSAVMEVTSHALHQDRVKNIHFNVAVFTNLSLDHLDYHRTMDEYCYAKNQLFRSLDPQHKKKIENHMTMAVVNGDSPWHPKILEGCKAPVLMYGIDSNANLKACNIQLAPTESCFDLAYQGKTVECRIPLTGRFNVYNCLAAASVALTRGASLEKIAQILSSAPSIPGRLQAVPNPLGLKIYVDFAHSDDSLMNVLECLRELKHERIITVFGCGGNRDATKRPKMAQVAEEYSDIVIITSDNPRGEDPEEIARQIMRGFSKPDSFLVELDRREAIAHAISLATERDIILIAGKGHETHQIFAHKTIEFDDAKVALQLCQEKAQMQECFH